MAVAAARLGRSTAIVSRTGDDPFGAYLHQALKEFGVDDRWVTPVEAYPTPVTFCEIFPPDDFPLYFYRQPKAPDLEIRTDELDFFAIRGRADLLDHRHRSVRGAQPLRHPRRPQGARQGRHHRLRPRLAPHVLEGTRPRPARTTPKALRHVTVAVGNLDECEVATGVREPRACAEALLEAGVELAVVKQGPKGVLAVHRDGTTAEVPPVPVEVVNGLGAGDAFGGSLCHGLLAGWELEKTMRYANAAGALVASRLACSSAMPTAAEVEDLVASRALTAATP